MLCRWFFTNGQEGPYGDPSFAFHDLPLPLWAQEFIMPVAGASVPQNPNLLPGAPRAYRHGIHEGVDIYCPFGTPVMAAKDGHVLMAGSNYQELPPAYRRRLLRFAKRLYQTPEQILKALHGRQVVLDHGLKAGRWVTTVYSHLHRVKEGLKPGDFVRQGEVIGYVGTSGTSKAGTNNGAHLHFEIRVNGHYLGKGMTPKEAYELLKSIFAHHSLSEGGP